MKLALTLPGWLDPAGTTYERIKNNPALSFPADNNFILATVLNKFGEVALYIGGFMMFFWAVWGVFDYLRAEGNKEALAKARKRIQWAIAGFIILLMAFFVSDALKGILNPYTPPVTNLTPP